MKFKEIKNLSKEELTSPLAKRVLKLDNIIAGSKITVKVTPPKNAETKSFKFSGRLLDNTTVTCIHVDNSPFHIINGHRYKNTTYEEIDE